LHNKTHLKFFLLKRRNNAHVLTLIASFIVTPFLLPAQQPGPQHKTFVDVRYQQEIKTLASQPVVKAAFQAIVDQEPTTLQNLITLTQIPAPPFKEEARAAKFRQLLQQAGADSIWTDKAGNVLALRRGKTGQKTVVIEGHLDTVFPEGTDVTVKRRGDTLFAPGVGDDTRGLTVVLSLLTAINKAGVKTAANIVFAGTTGEEGLGDLRGVKELFRSGPKIDSYISIDGGSLGSIVYGAVGSRRYRVTYKGQGGHSFGAFGLANPHNATAHAIHYFTHAADSFTRKGIKATYNIGVLGGGTSVNAIPFESWMEVDLRSEDPVRLQGLDQLLQQAIQRGLREENSMKRLGNDLTVDVKLVGDRPTGSQDSSLALVQRAAAASLYMGEIPKPHVSSTNANIPISKGVPGITIWQGGRGGGAHSLNEWWLNKNGHLAIQAALLLLLSEAGLAK
jgi:acetylornithine deacetylase/succinyl-diaminopimelate desuccinylase-like protein